MSISPVTKPEARPRPRPRPLEQTAPLWNVVVLDDAVNLMSYVTLVFRKVFGYTLEHAERLMLEVHQRGRSIVWTGELERAEGYVAQLQAHQLLAVLEKAA
jgi:ATP-dependent Clp protease adaptor protein ClpS